jgi:hypothetical protein
MSRSGLKPSFCLRGFRYDLPLEQQRIKTFSRVHTEQLSIMAWQIIYGSLSGERHRNGEALSARNEGPPEMLNLLYEKKESSDRNLWFCAAGESKSARGKIRGEARQAAE